MTSHTTNTSTIDPAAVERAVQRLAKDWGRPVDDPDVQWLATEQAVVDQVLDAAPAPGPCPSWCAYPQGHPYMVTDRDTDPVAERVHCNRPDDDRGALAVMSGVEQVIDGQAQPAADLQIFTRNGEDGMTGQVARRLAAELADAVALLDRIAGQA